MLTFWKSECKLLTKSVLKLLPTLKSATSLSIWIGELRNVKAENWLLEFKDVFKKQSEVPLGLRVIEKKLLGTTKRL